MPKYDRQVVAQFLSGGSADELIRDNAKAISDRAVRHGVQSAVCTMPIQGQSTSRNDPRWSRGARYIGTLGASSRLYLQGHGSWKMQKIGEWGPVESADLLVAMGLKACRVISILGCNLASDRTAASDVRVLNSADSFASRFQKALRDRHKLSIEVYARVWSVVPIGPLVQQEDGYDLEDMGRKLQSPPGTATGDESHQLANSKIRFFWDGGIQQRQYSY